MGPISIDPRRPSASYRRAVGLRHALATARGTVACALVVALAALFAPAGTVAQDDGTRQLWDTEFLQKRPKPKSAPKPRKKTSYRRVTPRVAAKPDPKLPAAPASESLVGVTLWRLRPAARADQETARILIHEKASEADTEWTPERVDVDTAIAEGQRIRLAVETPRDGYLYVLDREVYADGSTSAPVLIFPTLRTRGGDNRVTAGAVVEIPSLDDDPVYFTLAKSRPDHVAESLTILVTPEPLEGLKIEREARALPAAQVAAWERDWGAPVERLDLVDGVGTPYTGAEKAAGLDPKTQLTQEDPLPQTIYRVGGKPGAPILVSFALKLGA